jgi:hypothetical protein
MVHLAPVRQQASKCSEVLQQHIVWQIQIDKYLSDWQHTVAMNTLLQREKRATVSRVDDWLAFSPPPNCPSWLRFRPRLAATPLAVC